MSCPICGGKNIKITTQIVEGEEKKKVRKELQQDKSKIDFVYKGSKWIFEKSLGIWAELHGLPYKLGNEVAKSLTGIADAIKNEQDLKFDNYINQIPDLVLIEIKCDDDECGYIINRYSTYRFQSNR